MGKKNTKRLLISIATLIISLAVYFCSPFLINFNSDKKTGIENLLSELILYQVTIKGNIEYKLNPFPKLQLTEIYLKKDEENSVIDKIVLDVSIIDLLNGKFNYGDIVLEDGEIVVDIHDYKKLTFIEEFEKQSLEFRRINFKFFDKKNSFVLNNFNGEINFSGKQLEKINGSINLGELGMNLKYSDNKLKLKSSDIDLSLEIENLLNENKVVLLSLKSETFLPSINEVFTAFEYQESDEKIRILTKEFNTNLFNGNLEVNIDKDNKEPIEITGNFDEVKFNKVDILKLKKFISEDLKTISELFDAKIKLSFKNIKTDNQLFTTSNIDIIFQSGDIFVENINFFSENNNLTIKGRNLNYQKDNLFFYDVIFNTNDLKKICEDICEDQALLDKIINRDFTLFSKGILNINKGKVQVEENFTEQQFNDNELQQLNSNLNSLVLFGKLENIFNFSRYFVLL